MYPGLAVAQALLSDGGKGPAAEWPLEVVYVGSIGGVEERLVARVLPVTLGQLRGVVHLCGSMFEGVALAQAIRLESQS